MEGTPQKRENSAAATEKAGEYSYARESILAMNQEELRKLDDMIAPLRERLRAGENVDDELMPLLDKRGELARAVEKPN